jgi:O-antigen/teichoic acid export membrane protein
MAIAAPLIPHLVGKSFTDSVSALRWLCLLPVFRSFQYSAGDALTGAGHQKLRLGAQATAAVFNFGVNLYLIPHYGWLGAAWSSLATDGLLGVGNWAVLLAVRSKAQELRLVGSQT